MVWYGLRMTTKHAACTHPATKAARAACRRGTAQPKTKITGGDTGPVAEAKPEPPREPAPPAIFIDALGVKIELGDRVVVSAWGGAVRLTDVGAEGTVTGYGRSRVRVNWDSSPNGPAPVELITPSLVNVWRRDGGLGFQGNVDR